MTLGRSSWELPSKFGALTALNYLSATFRDCFTEAFNDSVHQNVYTRLDQAMCICFVNTLFVCDSCRRMLFCVSCVILLTFHSYSGIFWNRYPYIYNRDGVEIHCLKVKHRELLFLENVVDSSVVLLFTFWFFHLLVGKIVEKIRKECKHSYFLCSYHYDDPTEQKIWHLS